MLVDLILITVSFGLVTKGADWFVDSSLNIGRALKVPRFIIGGTLVSLATTTPELVVSVTASGLDDSGIALGNAIGSCICNIGLIIGTVAFITPVAGEPREFTRRVAWMIVGGVLVVLFSWDQILSRASGTVLLALSLGYLYWDYQAIRRIRKIQHNAKISAEEREELVKSTAHFY